MLQIFKVQQFRLRESKLYLITSVLGIWKYNQTNDELSYRQKVLC